MEARTFRVLAAVVVTACGTGDLTEPSKPLLTTPSAAIQDGANAGGNPDFFFLPPMVDDPSGLPIFLDNGLNPNLTPTVLITAAPNYSFQATAAFNSTHYVVNWQVPVSSTSTTYRVSVKVGTTELGFADVFAAANSSDLKNADDDQVALMDGRTLPIKFVIENFALCGTVAQPTCASETVNTAEGGTVTIPQGGVEIPPQPNGETTTVTVSTCPDIPSDLPSFGSCIRVVANPPLTNTFTVPAEVWVCDANLGTLSDQEQRVTMHRYDAPNTKALPHAHDQCAPAVTDAGFSVKGVVAELLHGRFRSAGRQLTRMLAPRPLYASAMLDVGAGGETDGFSDFQLLLPAKMTKCGGDGLTVPPGASVSPKICVTDLGGDPVQGATVHFSTSDGSVTPTSVVTGLTGEASAVWTISTTPGANSLVASGNGIASSTSDGPRTGFDPFHPFPHHGPPVPESGTPSGPVNVLTGSETFTATGSTAIRISGFADPRNRAPLIDASGNAPTGTLGSSQLVSALNNPAKFGPSGVVACSVDMQPFVQTIATGSLVSGGSRLVDVFFAGLTATTLTTAEASELAAFVNAGGILYITGNSAANEGPSYHPLFTALGATTTFGSDASVLGESVSSDPPDTTPFTNGPFGAVGPLSQSIYRPIQPGTMTGLATGSTHSEFVLVEGAFGSGRLSAMGDPMYMDQFTDDADNLNYFLNLFAAGCSVPPPAPSSH